MSAFSTSRTANTRAHMVVTGGYGWKRGRLVPFMPGWLRLGFGTRTR